MHGDERDDQLGGVSEGRVEEAADPGPRVLGRVLRGLADQPGEWDESGCGERELDRFVEVCDVVQGDRERPDEKTGEEDAADHERQPYPRRLRGQHGSAHAWTPARLPVSTFDVKSCATMVGVATIRA